MSATTKSALTEWRGYWFLPLVAGLGYATSVLHVYSLGPFFSALTTEFGWGRAVASLGLTITAAVSGIFCIPMGMLVDKFGPRPVGLAGVAAMTGAFALLGTANGEVWNWILLWGILAIGTFGVQTTVWTSAVASRFEVSRGLAFAITLSGASFAAAIFPVVATWLIGAYGWRVAYPAMGAMWAALVLPLVFFLFRGAQDQTGDARVAAAAAARAQPGMTLAEGLRSASLYKLLIAAFLFSFGALGIVVHFVPILTGAGATPMAAAGVASLVGIFSIIGRLGTGVLLDRYPAHLVGAAAFLLPITGCSLLLVDGSSGLNQSVAAAAFGLTVGSEVDVVAYLAARHFGLKNFGALYGAMVMALAVGTAFGPLVAGAVFDKSGNYAPFLMGTIVLMVAAAASLISLGPKPPPLVAEPAAR
jgi:MFS family permease